MADQPTENVPNSTLSALTATLVPTLIISAVYFSAFLFLRRSQRRFYAPRSYLGTFREDERTAALPNGWLNWIGPFSRIPDTSVLRSQSLDAYLFLRFLKMTVIIMLIGALITWPILFPVYITGGSGSGQLDMLSMSNIDKSGNGKYRYYASTFAGWIFFTFILFLVTRESIFYVNLRQAFLLSPNYAGKISSRTVLFISVPAKYRDESKLRQIYGSSVKRIWLTKDTTKIDELVVERNEVALKLEAAEINLIKTANNEKLRFAKKNKNKPALSSDEAKTPEGNTEVGSLTARWVPEKKRPTHRLGLLGLLGRKVDTINWCRERLENLIPATLAAQNSYKSGDLKKTGSVFIEFRHLSDAQDALQTLAHHRALQMAPRYICINPEEVIWPSLKISWSQRIIRRLAVISIVSTLIIFWAIPVGFVGLISNVNYLKSYSALSWLDKIPPKIMGLITGLLPAVALGILMSLVPIIIRLLAKLAGEPSLSQVELFTQNAYFVFQVVQVFLVATVASAATALIKQAIDDPSSITTILATKIPKASNFYISYFIVQGLTIASGVISQVVGFLIFTLMFKYFAKTPRSLFDKWAHLSSISWGSVLPVYTNIAVIGITYSCIAPLILGFATIGMFLFYCAYRYNILFVSNSSIDTKGLIYPRALQQLLTGVYLSEVCLIGLFLISAAIGPAILMAIFLVLTIIYHRCLNAALKPLLQNLPKTLLAKEKAANAVSDDTESGRNVNSSRDVSENVAGPQANTKPGVLAKFIAPHTYANDTTFREMIPSSCLDPNELYEPSVADEAYLPPSVKSEVPLLWIPKDNIGISTEEITNIGKIIPITDEGATISDDNKILWDPEGSRPPIWRPKNFY